MSRVVPYPMLIILIIVMNITHRSTHFQISYHIHVQAMRVGKESWNTIMIKKIIIGLLRQDNITSILIIIIGSRVPRPAGDCRISLCSLCSRSGILTTLSTQSFLLELATIVYCINSAPSNWMLKLFAL